jgi:hypothetical protein
MFRKPSVVVGVVTGVLLLYCVLIGFNLSINLANLIFAVSPLLLLWMTYTIIRHGIFNGKELQEAEEWGYQDKNKEELGMF